MSGEYDFAVVGAGMVGAAIAYGLAGAKRKVVMLDGEDADFRAAKANFGLVWATGKGFGYPSYQRLSLQSVEWWPHFVRKLEEDSGIQLAYEQKGGLEFCLSESEFSAEEKYIAAWHAQTPDLPISAEMLDRDELVRRFPLMRLGSAVVGASFGRLDGHVNPLRLLAALQSAFIRHGGELHNDRAVSAINGLSGGGFEVLAGGSKISARQVVIAAGLGSTKLAGMVGLEAPLQPQKGQILVTERLAPLLSVPAGTVRQTAEGTVLIGATHENVGHDLATTSEGAVRMARRALRIFPDLAKAKLVRQWACLRIMTPDGHPIYASSTTHPGSHIAMCHSGVTLASFHAGAYAELLAAGKLPDSLRDFHYERFDV